MKSRIRFIGLFTALILSTLAICQEPAKPPAKDAKAKSLTNTIKWATASEVDNFGFDIYRADKEDGPFAKINATPVEGAGTTDSPSYYQYVDDTNDPRRAYYYYVESISMDGVREHFTPVIKAKPKISE